MGSRGPVPKSSEDRIRRNKDSESAVSVTRVDFGSSDVVIPAASGAWCGAARRLWDSLLVSPQTERFFTQADWAYAFFVMDEITRYVESGRQNGQVLSSLFSALGNLLVVEGDRRRLGVEVSRAGGSSDEVSEKVAVMDEWRKRVDGL